MKYDISLGYYGDLEVRIDPPCDDANKHICLLGVSGGGKTVEEQRLSCEVALNGGTAVLFNLHGAFKEDQLLPYYKRVIDSYRRDIYAHRDGVRCSLFTPIKYPDGTMESPEEAAITLSGSISRILKLGDKQMLTLKDAAETVVENGTYKQIGIRALGDALDSMNTKESKTLKQRLGLVLTRNLIREGQLIEKGKINIVHLDNLPVQIQELMVEVLTSYICGLGFADTFKQDPIYLILDEIQNMSGSKSSPIATLLSEGRKMGINLVLATQMLEHGANNVMQQRLLQCGVMMYFKPPANRALATAKLIDPNTADKWVDKLNSLKPGEFIVCGDIAIGGITPDKKEPIAVTAWTDAIRNYASERKYSCFTSQKVLSS